MADNIQGGHVQGSLDEGQPAANERPVLVAGKDTVTGLIVDIPITGGAVVTTGGGGGGGAVTVADGADVTQGAIADAAVTGDIPGTVSAKLRGLNKILFDVWDSVNHWFRVGASQIGAWTVSVSNFPATQPISGTVTANQGTPNAAGANSWPVQGAAAPGGALSNPVIIGGENGGVAKLLHLNATGGPIVDQGASGSGGTASWFVQGAAATGAVPSGNPLLLGAVDPAGGTTVNPLQIQAAAAANLRVGVYAGATQMAVTGLGDAIALQAGNAATAAFEMNWNGTNFDRHRNTLDVTLLASASRTTTQTSADITTYNCNAITVILDMTTVGTGSVTVTIDGKDPASGKYYNLLTGVAIITNSTNVYFVDPAIVAAANVNAQRRLPRIIRIVVTANNANAATYSVGYTLQSPGG